MRYFFLIFILFGGFSINAGPAYDDAVKHLKELAEHDKLKGLLCITKKQSIAELYECQDHFKDYHEYKGLIKQLEAIK